MSPIDFGQKRLCLEDLKKSLAYSRSRVRLCALIFCVIPILKVCKAPGTLSRQFNCPICLQFSSFCSWAWAGNSAASISTLMIHCLKDLQGSPAVPPDKVLTSGFSWLAGLLPTRELRGIIHQNTTWIPGLSMCWWTLELLIIITYSYHLNEMLNQPGSHSASAQSHSWCWFSTGRMGGGTGTSRCCAFDSRNHLLSDVQNDENKIMEAK